MEYHEAVDALEGLRRLRPKLGTETTAALLGAVDTDPAGLTAVQVAGSNGKGSTARLLAGILEESGLDVGLYTSPDLNGLRERIRVNGRKIPRSRVVEFVETAWPFVVERSADGDGPTFFEAVTGMALWYFDRIGVDVAVLEVGIGGRYDATSVVDPAAAAVTAVSLEHTDLLGETVAEIARDKVHVAPGDRPLVTGATGGALDAIRAETAVLTVGPAARGDGATRGTATDEAGRVLDPDVRVREREMASLTESTVSIDGPDWDVETRTPLLGTHQAVNAGIAAALARQVAEPAPAEIEAGIRNVRWPGRFEVVDDAPLVVLDGAHNPGACETLAALLSRYDYDDLHLVFGAMREKDHATMIRALPEADRAFLAAPAVDRAETAATLAAVFDRETDAALARADSVLGALGRALDAADSGDCVLVAGSLYTVGEARDHWTRTPSTVRNGSEDRLRSAMRAANVPADERRDHAAVVQRTVRFHTRRARVPGLKETMLSLGGRCAVSGISDADQHVGVVLSGTAAQFSRLLDRLEAGDTEDRHLAGQLSRALDGGPGTTPWAPGTAVVGVLDAAVPGSEDLADRAAEMVTAGADALEVWAGDGAGRGTDPPSADEQRERLLPAVRRLDGLDTPVSVGTRHPTVAGAALDAGADAVHDATGLADAAMRRVLAEASVPIAVTHSLPAFEDSQPHDDVVDDVLSELTERLLLAERAGIDRSQVIVDPGFGSGPGPARRHELLDRLDELRALGTALLVGAPPERAADAEAAWDASSTVAATALAVERGVDAVRVRDVAPSAAAVRTARATRERR
jgi:dihydropteroate synthase